MQSPISTHGLAGSLPPLSDTPFDVGATDDSIHRMGELFERLGNIYRVYSPTRRSDTWVIHHPNDVKRVLVTNHRNYTKGLGLDRVKILLGNGIMTSEGEVWRRQRIMMQPAFHRRIISKFATVIANANDRLLEKWERDTARGELINVTDDVSALTLEIVLRSIFGNDLDRLTAALGANPFALVNEEPARDLKFAYRFRQLTTLVKAVLARRHAEREEHFDFMQMLMDARDKETGDAMSERELVDEIMTLIVAGHETTASGLNWTWYLLSQHPEVEARLSAELDSVPVEDAPGLPKMEQLTYTRQVVDEVLRLYPPGWLLSRRTIAADELGGYEIPPDTDVLFSPYLLHRHPSFWRDPEAFQPERFDAAQESERTRFAYMPFAAGPRHCIGETLALYEMYLHLYKVARHYRLTYVADRPLELEARVNLRSIHPFYMRLERRQ